MVVESFARRLKGKGAGCAETLSIVGKCLNIIGGIAVYAQRSTECFAIEKRLNIEMGYSHGARKKRNMANKGARRKRSCSGQ